MTLRGMATIVLAASAATLFGGPAAGQDVRFQEVFPLMEEVDRRSDPNVWPGFYPRRIPTAVFDGKQTLLFGFGRAPSGFAAVPGKPDVYAFPGQHEAVLGNRRALIEGTWVASVIPGYGPIGNHRSATLADLAAVVLHEKFHVFQILHHPTWRPNDLILLGYPLDRPESLAERRLELEAFERATAAPDAEEAAAWARRGLEIRRKRLAALSAAEAGYEREIARLEGLAQYIEHRAANRVGPDDVLADDIAPRGVRMLGYIEGCWTALLLDRFDPGWKERLEADDSRRPEDLLGSALDAAGGRTAEFATAEIVATAAAADADLKARTAERRRAEREFFTKLGYRLELHAAGRPFRFEMFDPFSIEAFGERRILHPAWITCRTADGTVRIWQLPCLTEVDGRGQIVRMILTGIERNPTLAAGWNIPFRLDLGGVRIELGKARVRLLGSRIAVEIGD